MAVDDEQILRAHTKEHLARIRKAEEDFDVDTPAYPNIADHAQRSVGAALQALFAQRRIDKRYVASLDGRVAGDAGEIALALRVDVDDRPRQIHDPVHGKPAITEWRVIARDGDRTRVALYPRSGRTHQLRVT